MNTIKFRMLAQKVDGKGFEVKENIPVEKGLSDDELVGLIRTYCYGCLNGSKIKFSTLKHWALEVDYPFNWIYFAEQKDGQVKVRIYPRDSKNKQHQWKADNYLGIWEKLDNMEALQIERLELLKKPGR